MKTKLVVPVAALALLAMIGPSASAGDRNRSFGYHGFGPQVGLSFSPDQLVVGGHLDLGEAFPHVRFQPTGDIGFGDHVTTFQANADFHYRFMNSWDVWNPYLGGGIGLVAASADGHSASDMGLHAIGGIEKYISSGKFFLEGKLGLVDESPDIKLMAGWTFVR